MWSMKAQRALAKGFFMKYAFLYIASVVLVNLAFAAVDPLILPGGSVWSPVALIVGFTFVIRDFVQREIGHWVLPAMLVGGLISWAMAGQDIAIASMAAFLAGETLDWAMYTFTGRPFSQRILLSSAVGTPIDSCVFMYLMGFFSLPSVLMMTASKMVGAVIVYYLTRRRELAAAHQA